MGVHELWKLLSPAATAIPLSSLASHRVAVDISIWLTQFLKAMRTASGPLPNAHLIGLIRRILRLHYWGVLPVFVFDGPAPALKRQTLAKRKRLRDQAQNSIERAAEKLLLNQLKMKSIAELRAQINANKESTEDSKRKKSEIVEEKERAEVDVEVSTDMEQKAAVDDVLFATFLELSDAEVAAQFYDESQQAINVDDHEQSETLEDYLEEEDDEIVEEHAVKVEEAVDNSDSDVEYVYDPTKRYVLPADGRLSASFLASLPISLQQQLLEEQREMLHAGSLKLYSTLHADINSFSNAQLNSFFTAVKFGKEVDQKRKEKELKAKSLKITADGRREYYYEKNEGKQSEAVKSDVKMNPSTSHSRESESLEKHPIVHKKQHKPIPIPISHPSKKTIYPITDDAVLPNDDVAILEQNVREIKSRYEIDLTDDVQTSELRAAVPELKPVQFIESEEDVVDISINLNDTQEETDLFPAALFHSISTNNSSHDKQSDSEALTIEGLEEFTETSNDFEEQQTEDVWDGESITEIGNAPERLENSSPTFKVNDISIHPTKEALDKFAEDEEEEIEDLGDRTIIQPFSSHANQNNEMVAPSNESTSINSAYINPSAIKRDNVKEDGVTYTLIDSDSIVVTVPEWLNPKATSVPAMEIDDDIQILSDADESNDISSIATDIRASVPNVSSAHILPVAFSENSASINEGVSDEDEGTTISARKQSINISNKQQHILISGLESTSMCEEQPSPPLMVNQSERTTFTNNTNPSNGLFAPSSGLKPWTSVAEDAMMSSNPELASELNRMIDDVHVSNSELQMSARQLRTHADAVTPTMVDEAKNLLSLFGLPFITAPAEAESQCAILEQLSLVDGVITDDSDVFLFGATNVYRNVFETKKYAEVYTMPAIRAKLGLERESLISIGMLLGSDYTEGIRGIGIVNAMEIVNAFPGGNDGLREFKEWCWGGSAPPKRPVLSPTLPTDSVEEIHNKTQAYRKELFKWKHRTIRQSWHVPITFPSTEVRKGYERPMVDSNKDKISWQTEINWDKLNGFLSQHCGFTWEECTKVRREWDEGVKLRKNAQLAIDRYVVPEGNVGLIKSKRIQRAVGSLTTKQTQEDYLQALREHEEEEIQELLKTSAEDDAKKRTKMRKRKSGKSDG